MYLAFSVLSSSLIFVIFKLFAQYRINTLFAIVVNYIVAFGVGLYVYQGPIMLKDVPGQPWFYGAIGLGVLFIVVFNLMAATSQRLGVSVASVATKMSLVIPVVFAVLMYNEALSFLKISGIVLALAAVYFASVKKKSVDFKASSLLLPLLVFLGSGVIDTSLKYLQEFYIEAVNYPIFSASLFGVAGLVGILYLGITSFKTNLKFSLRNIIGGIALGIPNYLSIFFLLKALEESKLNSASIFTINNVAIVMLSTLLGIFIFSEKIEPKNWGGIVLAVISIVLVALF